MYTPRLLGLYGGTTQFLSRAEAVENSKIVHIVGAGVVGSATGNAFKSLGHDVRYVELLAARRQQLEKAGERVQQYLDLGDEENSFIFVCVPTPSSAKGYDLAHLRAALRSVGAALSSARGFHVVVTRSTVAPRTWCDVAIPELEDASGRRVTDGFDVASAPEFLRQVSATADALSPRVTVVAAVNGDVRRDVAALFAPLGGQLKTFDDPTVAEVIKLANNCFNATKISFHNEIYKICQHLNVPQEVVSQVVAESAEGSYNPTYGIAGGYPYGGACLPKDLDGLIGFGEQAGLALPLLSAVREVNLAIASAELDEQLHEVVEAVD